MPLGNYGKGWLRRNYDMDLGTWISLSSLALSILGGIGGLVMIHSSAMRRIGRHETEMGSLVQDVQGLKNIPDRVLVLETELKHSQSALEDIKQSVTKLSEENRTSNHKIAGHLQDQSNQLSSLATKIEMLVSERK